MFFVKYLLCICISCQLNLSLWNTKLLKKLKVCLVVNKNIFEFFWFEFCVTCVMVTSFTNYEQTKCWYQVPHFTCWLCYTFISDGVYLVFSIKVLENSCISKPASWSCCGNLLLQSDLEVFCQMTFAKIQHLSNTLWVLQSAILTHISLMLLSSSKDVKKASIFTAISHCFTIITKVAQGFLSFLQVVPRVYLMIGVPTSPQVLYFPICPVSPGNGHISVHKL